jgi:hypothetical protein
MQEMPLPGVTIPEHPDVRTRGVLQDIEWTEILPGGGCQDARIGADTQHAHHPFGLLPSKEIQGLRVEEGGKALVEEIHVDPLPSEPVEALSQRTADLLERDTPVG